MQRDEQLGRLTSVGVRDRDCDRLLYRRVLVGRILDDPGIYIISATEDDVLDAVDEEEIAILIKIADIAGS